MCSSDLEFRVSIFEVREPSFEDRVSSFETLKEFFEDLEQRFRGNDLILENKTIAMNKTIDARLYSHNPLLNLCKYFFRVVHFLQDTRDSLIYTEANDSKLQLSIKMRLQRFLPKRVTSFCVTTTWSECVVFICANSTGRSKRKLTLTLKKCFSFTKPA